MVKKSKNVNKIRDRLGEGSDLISIERGQSFSDEKGWHEVEFSDRIEDPVVIAVPRPLMMDRKEKRLSIVSKIEKISDINLERPDVVDIEPIEGWEPPEIDIDIPDFEIDEFEISILDMYIDIPEFDIEEIEKLDPEEFGWDIDPITEEDIGMEEKIEETWEDEIGLPGIPDLEADAAIASIEVDLESTWHEALLFIMDPSAWLLIRSWNIRERKSLWYNLGEVRDSAAENFNRVIERVLDLREGIRNIFDSLTLGFREDVDFVIKELYGTRNDEDPEELRIGSIPKLANRLNTIIKKQNALVYHINEVVDALSEGLEEDVKVHSNNIIEFQERSFEEIEEHQEKVLQSVSKQYEAHLEEIHEEIDLIEESFWEQFVEVENRIMDQFESLNIMWGIPYDNIPLSVQVRNVSSRSFEWYSQGEEHIYWLAIGGELLDQED